MQFKGKYTSICSTLDVIKKIPDEKYNDTVWEEFDTNVEISLTENHSNRTHLAKLLRFQSFHHPTDLTSLGQKVERMKEKQDKIYFMPRSSWKDAESSPFVERLLKKG
ncbi:Endoplasmin [Fukomys damarensis]|uniref:Endoplasmin n=1 Tax=Fukomys damarensis TaxID=885580 RepID=A0A091EMI8_FUKDA|nr:Endoplasmin [Fukomys damarensis]